MAKKLINRDKILWIDLEMTGLNARQDKILELGAIVTDWDLNELDEIKLVLKQNQAFVEEKLNNWTWDNNPASDLIAQNPIGISDADFEQAVINFIHHNWQINQPENNIVLAGNTIRADRDFLDYHFPKITEYLHYRMLDVSAFKVYFDGRFKKFFSKPEPHRALDDIKGSIDELRYFTKYIKL